MKPINKISFTLIKYGTIVSIIIAIAGVFIFMGERTNIYSYTLVSNAAFFVRSVTSAYAVIIIGGLITDTYYKRNHSD